MLKDMCGQRFGRLLVARRSGSNARGLAIWHCICDCGREVETSGDRLRSGRSRSCGCSRVKHGQVNSRAYISWANMIARCTRPANTHYANYGGRGIAVCDRWRTFASFLADMGHPPEGTTLDRIQVDGNYEPENCRWVTRRHQQNNRRCNRRVTWDGRTQTMCEWADELGISRGAVRHRLNQGRPLAEVFSKTRVQRLKRTRA